MRRVTWSDIRPNLNSYYRTAYVTFFTLINRSSVTLLVTVKFPKVRSGAYIFQRVVQ